MLKRVKRGQKQYTSAKKDRFCACLFTTLSVHERTHRKEEHLFRRPVRLIFVSIHSIMPTMDKIFLEMLPVTSEGDRAKRWEEEKGEFAQICFREEARHIALFTLKKGFWRGMHYHEKKEEIFYVAGGSVRAVFIDMDTDERVEHLLTKGARLRVKPRCWHIFYGIDEATVVEYSPQVYESKDAYRIDMG